MEQNSENLPHDIWSHIFEKLNEEDLEEVSLVCKEFLSITSPLKTSLKIFDNTMPILPSILRRLQHLENVTVCVTSPYADLLHQISCSDLHSEGRKSLKTLRFKGKYSLDGSDLIAIADLFPWLEEIVIPCPVESREFEYLQLKVLDLRKVTFRGSHSINCSIISLPWNWRNLEEIDIEDCHYGIMQETIGFMMRQCPKLTSLKLPSYFKEPPSNAKFSVQNSIKYTTNLHTLSFYLGSVSEDDLCSFVEAKPPLKKLQLDGELKIETQYLMMLLRACSSMQDLSIWNSGWLSDRSVEEISQHLPKLNHILLKPCSTLSIESFFALTKNCPSLQVIKLPSLSVKFGELISTKHLHKRENILHLDLSRSTYLDDKALKQILLACPNLQSINLSWCTQLTDEGVQGLLNTCASLTELKFFGLGNVTDIFGKDFEGRTIGLKIIELGDTGINDTAFSKIGQICTGLELLSISGFELALTKTTVMEVVRNCKGLKKLKLKGCLDVNIKFLDDLVLQSSIKEIVVPNYLYLKEEEKMRFRKKGCKIWDFSDEKWSN